MISPAAQAADLALDQTLTVSGTTSTNRMGDAVAATSTYMVVGAPMDDALGTDAGAVYIFKNVNGTWSNIQKLTASDGAAGDQFGAKVAINGSTLAVGAPLDDILTATDAGSVYTFDLDSDTQWLQTQKITTQTPANYQRFGDALDMDAQRVVVGIPGHNGATSSTGSGRGAVSIWTRSGLNWVSEYLYGYTSPVTASTLAAFGHAVALSGDRIAVGAPHDYAATTGQGSRAGSMTILRHDSATTSWLSQQRLYSTAPVSSDLYGHTVDIEGNTLVTANYNIQVTSPRIFVYTYENAAWAAPSVIIPTSTSRLRYIGRSAEIAPDGQTILIGSYVTVGTTDYVGRVFVLRPDTTPNTWTQTQEMASPTAPTSATWYGYDVTFAGATPVVSAPQTSATGARGAVYTYKEGDATPPAFDFTSPSPTYLRSSYTVTITTSEPVTDFTQSDITVAPSAALGSFTQISPTEYSVQVTPNAGDGTYSLHIDAGKVQDAAGNSNAASANFTRVYDTTAPNATVISPTQATHFASPTIEASVRINDANGGLADLTADDIALTNGTISNFATTTTSTYVTGTFTITPTTEGALTLSVKSEAVTDQAGNTNSASTVRTFYYDTTGPTPTFSTSPNPTNASPFPVTLTFDEPINGSNSVTAAQISAVNGTVSDFNKITDREYQFMVIPTAVGTITLNYAANQVQDSAGNNNAAASAYAVTYDTFGPEVSISSSTNSPTNTAPIPITVDVSEAVNGLDVADFDVTNGTITAFTKQNDNRYTMSLNPGANGIVSIGLAAQKATDSAGNGNQASNTLAITYDTGRPRATISHSYTSPTNDSPLTYDISFTEAVSILNLTDIQLTNAVGTSLTRQNNREYQLVIAPQDGQVTVRIPDGVVQDTATNTNLGDVSTVAYDGTVPTGTVNQQRTNNVRPAITGTVNEALRTVRATVNGVTINGTYDSESGTWRVNANLFGPLVDGTYDVSVAFEDMAGNIGFDTTSNELTIDTDQPHITITAPTGTNQNPITFTVESDRAISNPQTSDFIVTNGTVTQIIQQSTTEFTVLVAPQANGRVTLQMKEGVVTDEVGNTNVISNLAESLYDNVRPTVTLSGSTTPTRAAFEVIADTNEELNGLIASDVSVTNGTVVELRRVTETRYAIRIQPASEGVVSVQVPAGAATDTAGNITTASNTLSRIYDASDPATPTVNSLTTTNRKPVLTGTFDATDVTVVQIAIGNKQFRSTTEGTPLLLNGSNWELNLTGSNISLEYGVYDVRVTTWDAAGNAATDVTTNEVAINSAGTITGTVDQQVTAWTQPELSGTVSHQEAVIYVKILNNIYTATNNRDGSWTLPANTIEPLSDGVYDIELTMETSEIDGADTTTNELTIDTAAPKGTLSRIVTSSPSPRLFGTVDTTNTTVWVELEGKTYEATTNTSNQWSIAEGTITPNLNPGSYTAVIYMERNDKQALSVVRKAITVLGASISLPPTPGPGTSTTPSPQTPDRATPKTLSPERATDTKTPETIKSPQASIVPRFPTAADRATNETTPQHVAVWAAICVVAASVASLAFFIIGWKRKRKKDEEILV